VTLVGDWLRQEPVAAARRLGQLLLYLGLARGMALVLIRSLSLTLCLHLCLCLNPCV
jgi:hypothetical protein